MFAFKAVGCHLKSTGAAQSALNPAGRREKRTGVRGGSEEEKHSHVRHQTGKRKEGGGTLRCYLFVFDLIGRLRKKKERESQSRQIQPDPMSFIVSFCLFDCFKVFSFLCFILSCSPFPHF